MKAIYSILFLTFCASIQAQFYIPAGTEINVDSEIDLYSNEVITNLGTISFDTAGNLVLDSDFDNTGGTLTLNDAILNLGSGGTNSGNSQSFKFATTDDEAKFVVFNKDGGTITVDDTGGFFNIIETFTSNGTGTLEANDRVVLKSTSIENTAIVPESTGGTINSIRVERFIPAGRGFRMLASPVDSDESIFENWQQGGLNPGDSDYEPNVGTHITGKGATTRPFVAGITPNGFDVNESGEPSMYVFDYTAKDFIPLVETSTESNYNNTNIKKLSIFEPYDLIVRGDRSVNLGFNDPVENTSTVLRQTGRLQIGNTSQSLNVENEDFIAISNPFQAPVNLAEVIPTGSSNFKHQVWVWQQTDRNSGQYVNIADLSSPTPSVTGSNVNEIIQPGQAVVIQANSTGNHSLDFNENFKRDLSNLTEIFTEDENQDDGFLRLGLYDTEHVAFKDLAYDGIIVRFNEKYTNSVDQYDGMKFANRRENIAMLVGSHYLSTNNRKLPKRLDEEITISTFGLKNQDYKFSVDLRGFESLENGILLYDNYTRTYTALEDGQVIPFSVDQSNPDSAKEDRFKLVFENATLGIDDQELGDISVYPNPLTSDFVDIQFSQNSGSNTTVELFDLLGKKVMTRKFDGVGKTIRLDNINLSSGVYLLNVKQDNLSKTFKIIKQ